MRTDMWTAKGFIVAAALAVTAPASAQQCGGGFERWLAAFKQEAAAKGISQSTLAAAAPFMEFDQQVISRDRGQKVFSQTFLEFSQRMVEGHRISQGAQRLKQNAGLFQRIEQQFGVPGPVLVAFWGLETDFGGFMGKIPTLRSVTTLAYDCRRPELFRKQLHAALQIIQRGDQTPESMIGPFAGELGQLQFLPEHYLEHAVDFDGDGRRDLIRSSADALASAANYMSKLGWKRGQPWLQEVRVPANMPWEQADVEIEHPRSQWV
jgi:lytic murein transglycosylase